MSAPWDVLGAELSGNGHPLSAGSLPVASLPHAEQDHEAVGGVQQQQQHCFHRLRRHVIEPPCTAHLHGGELALPVFPHMASCNQHSASYNLLM